MCDICPLQAVSVLGTPHARAITQRDRGVRTRALWRTGAMAAPRDTVTWWKSRRPLRAPARSVTTKVPGIVPAPPHKSLEVEPGNEASQDDV